MQSIERTAHRLTLKSCPWILWLAGSLCGVVGLALLATPKPSTQLTCTRAQGNCQLSISSLSYQHNGMIAIKDLEKAQLEVPATVQQASQRANNGSAASDTYAVVLHTKQQSFVFSHLAPLKQPEHEQVVRQINEFIHNKQLKTLSIEQKSHPGIYFFSVFCIALGGLLATAGRSSSVSFDRPSGLVKIVWPRLLKDRIYTFQMQNITEVRLERAIKRPSSLQPILKEDYSLPCELDLGDYFVYRIRIGLSDGSQIPLTAKFAPDSRSGADTAALVAEIQQFLQGIPLLTEAHGVRIDEIIQKS
jgi:hypothetical protein